jgi:broad specificity phosphatase PhoE
MRKDSYHIEMDNLSRFPIERSDDCESWEDVSQEELDALLDKLDETKTKNFLAVVRGGSFSMLEGYFYRIRPRS